ncbi:MAG TPA: exopolysaccharide biosynthesis polyprenyl glycosylphosphotransferase [Solirubrobacteraceae bacterium]|nr:exopolysaccharide biosynthesis polyprenyl glycosylphosphotransferase [Solirubrobacteraceae bacterium]
MPESRVTVEPGQTTFGGFIPADRVEYASPVAPRRWRRPLLAIPFSVLAGGLGLTTDTEAQRPIRERNQREYVARREGVFRRSLALADLLATGAAVVLAAMVLGQRALEPLALLALPLVVVVGKVVGIYDRDELLVNKATLDEAPRLFQLATLYTLLFVLLQGEVVSAALRPAALLALWISMSVFALLARGLARRVAWAATPVERCLFVGTEASAERLRTKLDAAGGHAVLVGRMSIPGGSDPDDAAEAAAVFHRVVEEMHVHRVVIEPSDPNPQATLDFVREAKGTGARVSLLPRILEVVGSSIEVDDVHGLTLLGVRRFGLSRSSAIVKRSFDIAGSVFVLVLLAPLLTALAVLVRFDSRGRAIYRQTRVGRDGRPFTMFKLRTMVQGADALKPSLRSLNEADGLFKIADDPRVTRVGRWLRHYSLDELPQLVNVLRGEMSLVGPRPLVSDDDAQITGLDRRRLYLTPGMTGPWQILGSARVPLAEMIKLDYLYVTGWSLWSDVKILLRTVPYVLARRGM